MFRNLTPIGGVMAMLAWFSFIFWFRRIYCKEDLLNNSKENILHFLNLYRFIFLAIVQCFILFINNLLSPSQQNNIKFTSETYV
jgi:hypothetical protein